MQSKQDYYVYVHRRLDTNEVFYVGSGRQARYKSKASRNKQWLAVVESSGYEPSIVMQDLTEEQAREAEGLLIDMYEGSLTNSHKPTESHTLDYSFLNELFYYDEQSPSGLRYKVTRYKNKGAVSKLAGEVAGVINYSPNGSPRSWNVKVTGTDRIKRTLGVHRVIWVLLNKSISETLVIDHQDGNPLNNNIANLKQVSRELNSRNKKPKVSRPNDEITGVYIRANKCWAGEWTDVDGVRHLKSFSIKKYGYDTAKSLAIAFRLEGIELLKEQDAGYTERHFGI